ncbi:hypothetical protein [Psychroserpens sp. MEBiC05023]
MKTFPFIISFFALFCFSCSSDDTQTPPTEPTPNLTQFVYEHYNTANDPNTINFRKTYTVENNKIVTATHESLETGYQTNRVYEYSNNGKITGISKFNEGQLIEQKLFTYDNDGNLIEYLREISSSPNSQAVYYRQHFTHTQDTIYGVVSHSTDGINFNISYTSSIVLDNNLNKTFLEERHTIDTPTKRYINTFDSNNNIMTSTVYEYDVLNDDGFFNTLSNTYSYDTGINTLGLIYEATFGRQVLMLSNQHIDNSTGLNYYNSKYTTTNTLIAFESTFFGNGNFEPVFSNDYNDSNYSIFSDYKLNVDNNLFTRFTYEFMFE